MSSSYYDELGGEAGVQKIVDDFVERCFADAMIGFMFRANASPVRVKEFEFQHAAEHLGAGRTYRGRPMKIVHGRFRIMGGQFMRRLQILKETLRDHEVPSEIADHWVGVHESLRAEVTFDPGSECR